MGGNLYRKAITRKPRRDTSFDGLSSSTGKSLVNIDLVLEPDGFESRVQMNIDLAQGAISTVHELVRFAGTDDEHVASRGVPLLVADRPL